MILEAANQAISYKAEDYFYEQKKLVIPDILGSSGKIISSYLEWLKNI